ncbi:hypothetical protein [Rhizobium leguminosarum]|uniref:hypothetical protein n=1 Tax=Rhizobium leguminosarum TaxID=384 RepID=UPI00047FE8D4|nr:hypothetical protein [Rhizobium leguminosarum]WFT86852.1 hypothetical protein QA638_04330 [Rhizobium leguminosarum]
MTAAELNIIYGAVIFPGANVSVSAAWMPAIHNALASFRDLPSSVRSLVIVIGIAESGGQLLIEIAAVPGAMPEDGMARIEEIVQTAREAARREMR